MIKKVTGHECALSTGLTFSVELVNKLLFWISGARNCEFVIPNFIANFRAFFPENRKENSWKLFLEEKKIYFFLRMPLTTLNCIVEKVDNKLVTMIMNSWQECENSLKTLKYSERKEHASLPLRKPSRSVYSPWAWDVRLF